MGRGTSKAGMSTSSTTTASLPPVTKMLKPPSAQDVAKGKILPQGGVAFDKFSQMTDDQKADVINDALGVGVPIFLDDSGLQRFTYFTGMSDKPTVVADSKLDSMKGTEIYRTVSNTYNSSTDIGYTAHDICDQVAKGDFTMYSASGGSVHGRAIYFADSLGGSTAYGGGRSMTMRAKITGGKGISEDALSIQYGKAIASGDKLAKACDKAGYTDGMSIYALAKGYTHYTSRGGYNMILNRSCLTVSDTYKKTNTLGGRW